MPLQEDAHARLLTVVARTIQVLGVALLLRLGVDTLGYGVASAMPERAIGLLLYPPLALSWTPWGTWLADRFLDIPLQCLYLCILAGLFQVARRKLQR